MQRFHHTLAPAIAALFFASGPATAATLHTISANPGITGGCGFENTMSASSTTTSVHDKISDGEIRCTVAASAEAGGGKVGIKATYTSGGLVVDPAPPSGIGRIHVAASSSYDVIISTPSSHVAGTAIPFALNASFDAALSSISEGASKTAFAKVDGRVEVRGSVIGIAGSRSSLNTFTHSTASSASLVPGVFEDSATPDHFIRTDTLMIDPDRAITVAFNLSGTAGVAGTASDVITTSFFDAMNTLSFAKMGPVFDLPDGYSAFTTDGSVVGNRWIGAPDPGGPSEIPLPAGGPLLLAGVLALGRLRRRR